MNAAPASRDTILLLGAHGQLGTELKATFENECQLHAFTRAEADLSQPEDVREIVADLKPAIILNAAAYTAVDKAESEPELAELINSRSPAALAEEAAKYGGLLVHYSTDYVFDGSDAGAWGEEDTPAPLNTYGRTKLAGEQAIAKAGGPHLTFRTSWVFAPHGKNFLRTILRLAQERELLTIVADQYGAPTSARALARGTHEILEKLRERQEPEFSTTGIYHMTCAGKTSWHGFAQAIVEEATAIGLLQGKGPEVAPISSAQYSTPARRPANSVLNNAKLRERFGVALPPWQDALHDAVVELGRSEPSRTESLATP